MRWGPSLAGSEKKKNEWHPRPGPVVVSTQPVNKERSVSNAVSRILWPYGKWWRGHSVVVFWERERQFSVDVDGTSHRH